jgi:pimeloyl-ACP methyl ester carboxylesterase
MRNRVILVVVSVASILTAHAQTRAEVDREDFTVETKDGFDIFVRKISGGSARPARGPLLLVNGGRPGVLASWDVDAPAPSTAAQLAEAGHTVYLMDARGFGRSEFPEAMRQGDADGPVAVRSYEVVRDIAAVVKEIERRHPDQRRLAAMGWATGSQWLGHYASLHPGSITDMIYYNAAYGGAAGGWTFQSIADPGDPALLDRSRYPAYRCSTADDVIGRLSEETDDQAFLARYAWLAMEGDEKATERDPPCFRFPSGPLADTLLMVNGRQVFDASYIEAHVLILRSERDFWSRPSDVTALKAHLANAASITFVELTDASHYVHLLPDERREAFLETVLEFTGKAPSDAVSTEGQHW